MEIRNIIIKFFTFVMLSFVVGLLFTGFISIGAWVMLSMLVVIEFQLSKIYEVLKNE